MKLKKAPLSTYDNPSLYSYSGYKTILNHPDMGQNNTICEDKYAYCTRKKVFLTREESQKCINKMDIYMRETVGCKSLEVL